MGNSRNLVSSINLYGVQHTHIKVDTIHCCAELNRVSHSVQRPVEEFECETEIKVLAIRPLSPSPREKERSQKEPAGRCDVTGRTAGR